MSVSVTRAPGVTVMTVTSDPSMACPPLCQVLWGFCYSPACCSLSPRLRGILAGSQPVLATLHIMVGLLTVAMATILCNSPGARGWQDDYTAFPFWMSGLFVSFGVLCLLSEKFPSPCLVIFNVIVQLLGVCFAAVALVMWILNMATIDLWDYCEPEYYDDEWRRNNGTAPTPASDERCLESKDLLEMLLTSINGVLIALAVLELAVAIASSVVGIKALRRFGNDEEQVEEAQSLKDGTDSKPLLV